MRKIIIYLQNWYKSLGPGFITLEADNDQGAITTYVSSGAKYGLAFFPLLLVLLPVTFFCQETSARLAVVTQKGLISLIKENFGIVWAKIAVYNLYIVNFLTLITEFAGINLISKAFNLNPYITIPLSIIFLCFLVFPQNYQKWERLVVFLCIFDFIWFVLAFFTPYKNFHFNFSIDLHNTNFLYDIMAVIGTTVAPWQLYSQSYCILDKGISSEDLSKETKETLFGSVFTILIAGCMMLLGSLAFFNHIPYTDVPNLLIGLKNILSPQLIFLFFVMIINASIIGTIGVSIATAYAYAEDKNLPRSLNNKIHEAKSFYFYYFGIIVLAGLVTLIPSLPLDKVILGVQIVSCIFLPYQLIINQILCNNERLMKDYKNKIWQNVVMVLIIAMILILSVFLFKQALNF